MPDLLAGTVVLALDRPVSQYATDDTLQSNINTSGGYVEPTNQCRVTFTAPTSGRVKIVVGGGFRDETNNNQGFLGVEIRETNVSGAVVAAASAYVRGIISMPEASDYYYHSRITIMQGLRPGQVYFARIMMKTETAGSASVDLRQKNLAIIPVP
ncbi:hypothetical protein [Nonomuraea gerenzanensis]|uniref:Uncharacterized protein n=1 Tax=Nonomuraea gerenzanensis TaxID=93944 RepID=A0A1M4EML8_9ACTN|nr:hypothetical protein [Nonomuraea gerenzanensis]UBU11595.1 hypothetical protein LCN96_46030 [Nonomuraea gerenzanensis]SBP00090.1 hypothetical protein BN4615_P9606 [Nonomuraea gerenzanensis]